MKRVCKAEISLMDYFLAQKVPNEQNATAQPFPSTILPLPPLLTDSLYHFLPLPPQNSKTNLLFFFISSISDIPQ